MWGLCPFHAENTPSFSVDPEQQLFYCFGCRAGGTVFTFLVQLEGREFRDVVDALAEEAGIARPDRGVGRDPADLRRQRLLAVCEWTEEYFVGHADDDASVSYLATRQIAPEIRERFRLGYAPDEWDGLVRHLNRRGVTPEEMEAAGVVVRRRDGGQVVDRWRGRLMFPIWDADGRVVGFGGRATQPGQEPKYLNSPETELFHKGDLLYASHLARPAWRRGQRPLVVEGYMDVLACHGAGLTQAVASLGTALSEQQARFLRRYHSEADLLYDGDEAGRLATRRAFLVLSAVGMKVNGVELRSGKDPDELVRAEGPEALHQAVEGRRPYLDMVLDTVRHRPELASPRGKAQIVEEIRPLWQAIPDPVERDAYVDTIAIVLGVQKGILSHSFARMQGLKHTSAKNRHNMERAESRGRRGPSPDVRLLAALIRRPEYVARVQKRLPEWLERDEVAAVVERISKGASIRDLNRWIETADPAAQAMVLAALAHDEPDGGEAAIDHLMWGIEKEALYTRWRYLIERTRTGDTSPELMQEMQRLRPRLGFYQSGREG